MWEFWIPPSPKTKSKRKRGNRRIPLPFRGKRAENCLHNVGKSLGEGLAHEILRRPYVTSNDLGNKITVLRRKKLKFRSFTDWQFLSLPVSEFQSFFVSCRRTYVLKNTCLCVIYHRQPNICI